MHVIQCAFVLSILCDIINEMIWLIIFHMAHTCFYMFVKTIKDKFCSFLELHLNQSPAFDLIKFSYTK